MLRQPPLRGRHGQSNPSNGPTFRRFDHHRGGRSCSSLTDESPWRTRDYPSGRPRHVNDRRAAYRLRTRTAQRERNLRAKPPDETGCGSSPRVRRNPDPSMRWVLANLALLSCLSPISRVQLSTPPHRRPQERCALSHLADDAAQGQNEPFLMNHTSFRPHMKSRALCECSDEVTRNR